MATKSLHKEIFQALITLSSPERKASVSRYFKTGDGEYSEGDKFIGVTVPEQRSIAKDYYTTVNLKDIDVMLQSSYHEMRAVALMILVFQYEKSKDPAYKKELANFYLTHTQYINNWDLVDLSCYKVLGRYCYETNQNHILLKLSKSKSLWEQRIAIVSTMYYIKKGFYQLTLDIALKNLHHTHDLMHKANGWLLREVGQKDEELLLQFLEEHYLQMPRTSLRYAIEKMEEPIRQAFLKGKY